MEKACGEKRARETVSSRGEALAKNRNASDGQGTRRIEDGIGKDEEWQNGK